ncbi:uncharacterized protein LOC128673569 [Plodia interpunctella]|uniref:uncharacterized protein LOC128673569 n=1 Tax=Plodia interpunctella TaxID=58824 RepID=UPI002367C3A9|nr:uncharacterized protein LOC128673569 [Plodia interpunctella]
MLSFLISGLIPVALVLLFKYVNKRYEPPIFGIYQMKNKNYWFKFVFMFILIKLRQLFNHVKRLLEVESGRSADGIAHVHQHDVALEQKYFLGDNPHAIDAVYFNGVSEDAVFVCNIARKQGFVCDALLMLKVNGEELLLHPNLPETRMNQERIEEGEYRVQGIEIKTFMPMRTWKISYNGELKSRSNPDKRVNVKLSLTWSAHFPPFNYDTQISAWSLARDMAREQWSATYFKLMKKLHQTHYEQMGFIKGTVTLNDQEHAMSIPCVRDHSFGPFRDWRTFHRYVLHFIFLENGDSIAVGVVSQPSILSHLTIGYVCRKLDNQKVFPVDSCDLQLYQHGENKIMPKDYAFSFNAGRQSYVVRVSFNDEEAFYIGDGKSAKIYERWCAVEVNDVKGRACVECQYKNV